jgi:NAD(P)-dependent dehydrogenase (short-subunit alcohol dehydrogenase family)
MRGEQGSTVDIAGSVALVTGGSSGLGLATAEAFLREGARVVICGRDTAKGDANAARLGDGAVFVPGDVTSEQDIAAALDAAAELGTVRIAVNCAGVSSAKRTLGGRGPHPLEDFARVVQVNLIGTFNVLRLAAERISLAPEIGGERGVIITTASVAAFDGQMGQTAYAASKSGVVGLTLPAARDLAPLKIRVVSIAPGLFRTPLLAGLPDETVASLGAQVPHPARFGDPSEFAALAAHVVRNPMLNGETIRLDGAIRMSPS